MDAIKGILAEYYWIFLIVGILVLVTLIGFISSVKKKAKEQQPQVAEENPQETQQSAAQPEMPQPTGATLDLTPVQSQQPYVEPSLDGLASSATEVKLGFDTNEQASSIFENEGPMLVIEDPSASQAQPVVAQPQVVEQTMQPIDQGFGLVIEDPAAVQPVAQPTSVVENEGPMLIIEDPSVSQPAPVQPVAVEPQPVVAQPQVVEAVAQPAVVQQQVVAQPAPMVQPEPAVLQPVAQVAPAPQPVPVAQPVPVQQPVQAVPVQTVQPVAQPMPAPQPVQQPASIFETDAPTLVIPDPSANQQQM